MERKLGEIIPCGGDIILNEGRRTETLVVTNTGDRAVQVGSHYHFFEVNRALKFDREKAFGMHLDIPAGTAVRFEPGDEKEIHLVTYEGKRVLNGFNGLTYGCADDPEVKANAIKKAKEKGFM